MPEATAISPPNIPEDGQIVRVRQRLFVVNGVEKQSLPVGSVEKPQHLVHLGSIEDDGLGETLDVIWEIEPGAKIEHRALFPNPVEGLDNPDTLSAFMDAIRWGAISQGDDKNIQSPFRSGIEIDEYQLEPVVRALQMPRVNLLLADDVGLGKTIEAGLVLQEMLLRHKARSVLILCSASLQIQWQEEMRDKFGLEFKIVDRELISKLRRERGIRANPWAHFPRLIASIDYIKREIPFRMFRETLPAAAYPRKYDFLIVDEAHNIAPSGRGQYSVESQRTKVIKELSPHFEHKLFLSATPHNGYTESFTALLEMLDPQRFAKGTALDKKQLDAVMVRRMKRDLMLKSDGSRRFADREVLHMPVAYTDAEVNAHKALSEYSKNLSSGSGAKSFAGEFVAKLLKKRFFSSPIAFAKTLSTHTKTRDVKGWNVGSKEWEQGILATDNTEYPTEAERDQKEEEALAAASAAFGKATPEDKRLLAILNSYATTASSQGDCKLHQLITWLKTNIRPNGVWSTKRVIIFTEYLDTLNWLHDKLAVHGFAEEERLLQLYGGLPLDDREIVKAAFQANSEDSKARILLATDAAAEGLNLQNHCNNLFHYEIPWNPSRMEQRNGRIDRHGQKEEKVNIYHFVSSRFNEAKPAATGTLEGDLEFLYRIAKKVNTIREDLGTANTVLADQVESAMLGKRAFIPVEKAEADARRIRDALKIQKAERELAKELSQISDQLCDTKKTLNLTPEAVEHAIRIALKLAGQPDLQETTLTGVWPDRTGKRTKCPVFRLPSFHGTWGRSTEGLAHPHTHKIRPIVFDPKLAEGRDDVVLVHLNHRLAQMCLRLLRAELWAATESRKIHRVTAMAIPKAISPDPVLMVFGRLVVLGGDTHRLHEEIIFTGGTIKDGRYARLGILELEKLWAAAQNKEFPAEALKGLINLWPKHYDQVDKSLAVRMQERTKNLQDKFNEKAEIEVSKMKGIFSELEKNIKAVLLEKDDPQLLLWSPDEQLQFERDKGSLKRRLSEIPKQMAAEENVLRTRFKSPFPRVFPAAVIYLIPDTAASKAT